MNRVQEDPRRIRVGINGAGGRVGKSVLRALLEPNTRNRFQHMEVVALVAPDFDLQQFCDQIEYDSIHGWFEGRPEIGPISDSEIAIGDVHVSLLTDKKYRDARNIPWGHLGVDLVIECTGKYKSAAACQAHIESGTKRVIISAPGESDVSTTAVFGINHRDPETGVRPEDMIVSAASCTTTAASTVAKALKYSGIEFNEMIFDTVHAMTGDQNMLDGRHKKPDRARAAADHIIPTSSGAGKALVKVVPGLNDQVAGSAVRVPTSNVSLVSLILTPTQPVTREQLKEAFEYYCHESVYGNLLGINTRLDTFSGRYNHTPLAAIVDLTQVVVTPNGRLVKIPAWYDNEFGYGVLLALLADYMAMQMLQVVDAKT